MCQVLVRGRNKDKAGGKKRQRVHSWTGWPGQASVLRTEQHKEEITGTPRRLPGWGPTHEVPQEVEEGQAARLLAAV